MKDRFGLNDLRLIQAIGQEGTLTGAARRLGIDHSTAFRRLGGLETRLGAGLFQRARDGYTPTLAGEAALASANRILGEADELERRLAGEDLRPSGEVRVTTTDTLIELLSPVFVDLRSTHPEITLEVVVANAFFTLTKRDADIAIRPANTAPENLVGRRMSALATALYAAPSYLQARSKTLSLRDHDWIGFEESLAHLGSARWILANVPTENMVVRASSLLALRAMARDGMGVAALPCFMADPDPELVRLRPPISEMESSLWLLTHPDLRRVARIRAVLDFIAAQLKNRKQLLEEGNLVEEAGELPAR
jgi:DNA-binding transcriptional LysR family regulator